MRFAASAAAEGRARPPLRVARLLLTRPATMTPLVRITPTSPARRVSRAALAWAYALTSIACAARPRPPALTPVSFAAPPDARSEAPTIAFALEVARALEMPG